MEKLLRYGEIITDIGHILSKTKYLPKLNAQMDASNPPISFIEQTKLGNPNRKAPKS